MFLSKRGNDLKRMLVIEDNANNMKLITFILEKKGYGTIKAENGLKGIKLAVTEKPVFILLDIQLPDLDGYEVLKRIRNSEADSNIQIITVTSYAMTGDRKKVLEAGFNGYIEKPIDPFKIINQIKEIIGEEP
jgi:CheY-like chemotaxis protein